MNYQAFKKARFGLGLTAVALTIGAFAAVGSAAAATQHWASATPASKVPQGTPQSFTGKNQGNVTMSWRLGGGHTALTCTGLSASGSAANPTGGGAGTLSGISLGLTGCVIAMPGCKIAGEAIPFQSVKGYAWDEAAEEKVRFQPTEGTVLAVVKFESKSGETCGLASEIYMTGFFDATAKTGQAGSYSVSGTPNLKMSGAELNTTTELILTATSGQALTLSSEGSPGVPHWYLAAGNWTVLPAGVSTNYLSTAVPLTLNTKVAGAKTEISGCEGLNVGSVENPAGGGAGTASSKYTPEWASGCQISTKAGDCVIESSDSIELVGVATEVGAVPAVEWTPKSGSAVMVFHVGNAGALVCSLPSTISVTGKLIATSKGDGRFNLAASELKIGVQNVTISSEFGLEQAGKSLRLQP